MKRTIKKAKIEYKCDITGKNLDFNALEKEIGCHDPSHLELNLMVRNKRKIVKQIAAEELGKKQSELTQKDIDYYDDWGYLRTNGLDFHPEIAYEIYKFLRRKYPEVVKNWIEDYQEIVNPMEDQ